MIIKNYMKNINQIMNIKTVKNFLIIIKMMNGSWKNIIHMIIINLIIKKGMKCVKKKRKYFSINWKIKMK